MSVYQLTFSIIITPFNLLYCGVFINFYFRMTKINVIYFKDESLKLWFDSRTKLNKYILGKFERRNCQLIIFMSATQSKEYFTHCPRSCKLFYLKALNVTDFNTNHSFSWKQGLWVQAWSYYKIIRTYFSVSAGRRLVVAKTLLWQVTTWPGWMGQHSRGLSPIKRLSLSL